jgi:hypothetical protein
LIAYISANIGATNKLPSTEPLHSWPEKEFETSLGCQGYFSMTQLPLQVKRTVVPSSKKIQFQAPVSTLSLGSSKIEFQNGLFQNGLFQNQ